MTAPHHTPDGKFRSPWPGSELPGRRDLFRMMRERVAAGNIEPPRGTAFPVSTPDIVYPRADAGEFRATWIGHSSVLLQIGGLNVITDPVFSERASPVQWAGPRRVMAPGVGLHALPPIDVVLMSHNHYDHFDTSAVRHLAKANQHAVFVAPLGVGALLKRCGAHHVVELDWWQSAEVRGMTVSATPARHFSGRWLTDRNKTLWSGFALTHGNWRGYFVGDTAYHDQFADVGDKYGPFDFVMMPIGAYEPRWFMGRVHVDPAQAVQAFADVVSAHPHATLPLMLGIHWGTFRLTDEPMDEPPRQTRELWSARGFAEDRLWVARFGETRFVVRELAHARA